jgi:hypothetical protein
MGGTKVVLHGDICACRGGFLETPNEQFSIMHFLDLTLLDQETAHANLIVANEL